MASYKRPVWLYRFELSPGKWVYVPDEETKNYGRELIQRIQARWSPPTHYVHLGNKGHVRVLRSHLSDVWFARIDIQGFYGSISKSRITRHLTSLLRGYEDARAAAVMSTVPNPSTTQDTPRFVLPFGFVQSPIVATLCLDRSRAGRILRKLDQRVKRSVYVDDILLSTSHSVELLENAYRQVCSAVVRSGFALHEEKLTPPSEQTTIFNIDIAARDMRVSGERLERFRDELRSTNNVSAINGILGYVRSVNPSQADSLQRGTRESLTLP